LGDQTIPLLLHLYYSDVKCILHRAKDIPIDNQYVLDLLYLIQSYQPESSHFLVDK